LIFRLLPLIRILRESIKFETFLEGLAQCKCSIKLVGCNEHDVFEAITMMTSRILNEANQPVGYRQCKLTKLGITEARIIKLFQTMNKNEQIGSFESNNEVSILLSEYRKGFLLRLVYLGDATSVSIWLEAYKANFNEELPLLASDSVINLSIELIKPHGRHLLVKVIDGVALNFPCVEKLEIFWDYGSNEPNNAREPLLHEHVKIHEFTGKSSRESFSLN